MKAGQAGVLLLRCQRYHYCPRSSCSSSLQAIIHACDLSFHAGFFFSTSSILTWTTDHARFLAVFPLFCPSIALALLWFMCFLYTLSLLTYSTSTWIFKGCRALFIIEQKSTTSHAGASRGYKNGTKSMKYYFTSIPPTDRHCARYKLFVLHCIVLKDTYDLDCTSWRFIRYALYLKPKVARRVTGASIDFNETFLVFRESDCLRRVVLWCRLRTGSSLHDYAACCRPSILIRPRRPRRTIPLQTAEACRLSTSLFADYMERISTHAQWWRPNE